MKRALAFFILCFFTLSVEALAAPCGKVTHVEGRVDVLHAGANLAVPVSPEDPVEKGDIFRAKTLSRAEITLINRNVLRIGPGTRIEITEATAGAGNNNSVVRLFRGKVQAVAPDELVKKVAAFTEGRKFEVHTENAVAGIRDTNMLVSFEGGATSVIFLSGKGYLYNPEQPAAIVSLVSGYTSVVTTGAPTQARPASDNQVRFFLVQVTPSQTSDPTSGTSQQAGDGSSTTGGTVSFATAGGPSGGQSVAGTEDATGTGPQGEDVSGSPAPVPIFLVNNPGVSNSGTLPPVFTFTPAPPTNPPPPVNPPETTTGQTPSAPATQDFWKGGDGTWSSTNWSLNTPPSAGNDVSLVSSPGTVTYDAPSSTLGQVTIGSTGSSSTTLSIPQGTLTAQTLTVGSQGAGGVSLGTGSLFTGNEYIGYSGMGTFNQGLPVYAQTGGWSFPDGGLHKADSLYLGGAPGGVTGTGTYNLGAGILITGSEYVGYSGTGTFNQGLPVYDQIGGTQSTDGGSNFVNSLFLGGSATGAGTYNLGAGTLLADDEYVGNAGTGTFKQSGGTNSVADTITIGSTTTGSGAYSLSGGLLTADTIRLVDGGRFTQTGGTLDFTTFNQSGGTSTLLDLSLGGAAGSAGTYNLDAGMLFAANEYIGDAGTGRLTQSGGTNQVTGSLFIGGGTDATGGTGAYNLGGGALLVGGNTYVGYNLPLTAGSGVFNQGMPVYNPAAGWSSPGGTHTTGLLYIGGSKRYGRQRDVQPL